MTMQEFTFQFTKSVTIKVSESLAYLVGNEEFEKQYFPFTSLEDIAHHIVWNRTIMGWQHVEGLLPEEHDLFQIVGSGWDDDD